MDWPILLRSSFGNVLPNGRWAYEGVALIAAAINGGDWTEVEEYAHDVPWEPSSAS